MTRTPHTGEDGGHEQGLRHRTWPVTPFLHNGRLKENWREVLSRVLQGLGHGTCAY